MCPLMDTEKAFEVIQTHIKNEEYDKVRPIIDSIVSSSDDIHTLLKCASLLKVTEDEDGCQEILDIVIDISPGAEDKLTVAMSLRNLGRPDEAYELIKNEEGSDTISYEKARTLTLMDEYEEALSVIRNITSPNTDHRILLSEILCSLGEFREAYDISSQLVKDEPSYASLVNLCSAMIFMGKRKDAVRMVKQHMKEKKDADSLALSAYVMRVDGRIPAAAAYAHRSLSADHTHKGALETMAYCLIEKSRFIEAKIIAGAINERCPGDPAAIRILDACRLASGP